MAGGRVLISQGHEAAGCSEAVPLGLACRSQISTAIGFGGFDCGRWQDVRARLNKVIGSLAGLKKVIGFRHGDRDEGSPEEGVRAGFEEGDSVSGLAGSR